MVISVEGRRRRAKRQRRMASRDVDDRFARARNLADRNAEAFKLRVRDAAAAKLRGEQICICNHALRNDKAEYIHFGLQVEIIRKCVH